MPTFKALGGLTAISHDREYPVVNGVVELPEAGWWADLEKAGMIVPYIPEPAPLTPQTQQPEPEALPSPTVAEITAQGELIPPAAPEATPAAQTSPVAPVLPTFPARRAGRRN